MQRELSVLWDCAFGVERALRQEHQEHDRELEMLKGTTPLSASQQWRISELKKLKLMAKDRMESIIRNSAVNA